MVSSGEGYWAGCPSQPSLRRRVASFVVRGQYVICVAGVVIPTAMWDVCIARDSRSRGLARVVGRKYEKGYKMKSKRVPSFMTKLRNELDQALAREAVLQGVVYNLCKLQERQEKREEGGQQGPWPDWGEAWEQAFAVRYGASQAGAALLEQLEAVVEREAVLIQELSFWSNADDIEMDLISASGHGWKCWLSGEQRDHADRAREICSALKGDTR